MTPAGKAAMSSDEERRLCHLFRSLEGRAKSVLGPPTESYCAFLDPHPLDKARREYWLHIEIPNAANTDQTVSFRVEKQTLMLKMRIGGRTVETFPLYLSRVAKIEVSEKKKFAADAIEEVVADARERVLEESER